MHLRINAFVIFKVKIAKNFIDLKLSTVVFIITNSKIIYNVFMIITKSFHTIFDNFNEIIIDIDFIIFDTSKMQ